MCSTPRLGLGRQPTPDKWGAPPDLAQATRRFFVELADTAARRWQEQDQGIWEIRGEPRDFLYSKLMCWVALDRAVDLAGPLDASDRVDGWKQSQAQIREAILTKGWSDKANAFTQSFGSNDLDTSNLMLPLVGFLPADEPRVLSTINATEERLTDERGLVYRYLSHDGLEGKEGTFLLCTFWLAQALARAGQAARARTVFERALAFVNDVGLLAEEVDPVSGDLLGNFPQAFSHTGLVNAAWAISEAERRQKSAADNVADPGANHASARCRPNSSGDAGRAFTHPAASEESVAHSGFPISVQPPRRTPVDRRSRRASPIRHSLHSPRKPPSIDCQIAARSSGDAPCALPVTSSPTPPQIGTLTGGPMVQRGVRQVQFARELLAN